MPVLLDQNNLLPLLGVAASRSHYLPVQVIESGAFIGLGTVVSVIASANYGDQVLRARLSLQRWDRSTRGSQIWRTGDPASSERDRPRASACSRFVARTQAWVPEKAVLSR